MIESIVEAESHRRIIGVGSPFDLSMLRSGYLRLIKENHPDRYYGDPTKYAAATEKAKQINLSFQFLSEYLEKIGGTYSYTGAPAQSKTSISAPKSRPNYSYEGERYAEGFPDASITEIFLKSSHIISTGYKKSERLLYIKFKGNRVYRYYDFPEALFDAFLSAESHGKFAHQNIYKSFRYERL